MPTDIVNAANRIRRIRSGEKVTDVFGGTLKPMHDKRGEVISFFEDPTALAEWHHDCELLITDYLTEHPADDNEPVTQDWLRSIHAKYNGTQNNSKVWIIQFPPSSRYFRFDFDGDGWGMDIVDISSDQSMTVLVDRSRGDVRRLWRAMGINGSF